MDAKGLGCSFEDLALETLFVWVPISTKTFELLFHRIREKISVLDVYVHIYVQCLISNAVLLMPY